MSAKLVKSPIFATALIVGLVGVTALVAGYVDRPGTGSEVAAAEAKCADCPKDGTSECCKVKGACSDAAGSCTGGGCGTEAALAASSCPAMAGAEAAHASMSGCPAQTASVGTCPASGGEVASVGCGGGACCPAGE